MEKINNMKILNNIKFLILKILILYIISTNKVDGLALNGYIHSYIHI